ncbi:MAG: hypothetical protein WC449_05715 [Candidatus Paceibacterota bacterium]
MSIGIFVNIALGHRYPIMTAHGTGVVFIGENEKLSRSTKKTDRKYNGNGEYNAQKFRGKTPKERIMHSIRYNGSLTQGELRNSSFAFQQLTPKGREEMLRMIESEGHIKTEIKINPYNKAKSLLITWLGEE